jgi:SAM-dependent methyltransferase
MKQTPAELREHYDVERELADRLRRASKEERRELYSVVYAERSARIPHHPLVQAAADPAARALAVAPQVRLCRRFVGREHSFLEVGAGDGAVALALAPFVKHSTAADVTTALAPSGPRPGNFEFVAFDGFELPLPAASVDFVYSNDVAEHLHPDDLPDHLHAVRRVLRPGGRYLCVTPNRLSGPHDVSRHFASTPEGFHLREYSLGELSQAFAAAGFAGSETVTSVAGYAVRAIPGLPVVRSFERVVELLPQRARRVAARPLAAVKLVGRA